MNISINKNANSITGNYGKEIFGIPFDQTIYDKMVDVASKANTADSVNVLKDALSEFEELVKLGEKITNVEASKIPNVVKHSGNYYLENKGVVSSIPMPEILVQRLEDSIDKSIDPTPLVKAWTLFLRNPKLRKLDLEGRKRFSEKVFNYVNIKYTNKELKDKFIAKGYNENVAEEMATIPQVKITQEGLLCTFKVSRELTTRYKLNDKGEKESYNVYQGKKSIDEITGLITYEKNELTNEERVFEPYVQGKGGDAFYCGASLGHLIKVGQVHRLPDWTYVNCNDDSSCVKGLHIGNIDYIKGYQEEGTCTHNVLVDFSHIGAVPDDVTGAIRCIQYFVLDEFSGVNGSIYHSSQYAKHTEAQWEEYRKEILQHFGTISEEYNGKIKQETSELNSL